MGSLALGDPRPRRQKRWKHHGAEPLTDWKQLPKGWNSKEPDLDLEYVAFACLEVLSLIDTRATVTLTGKLRDAMSE